MANHDPKRPSVKVEESKWTGYFSELCPLPCSAESESTINNRRDNLVRKVRCLIQEFISKTDCLLAGMKTVDALERLGLGYHFQQDISMLMHVLRCKPARADDLFAVSLWFRLLRQHHHDISSDVFKNFMDDNGAFRDSLRSNVDGLLSLYEAAHLGKSDEYAIRSAIIFTRDCLSSLLNDGHLPKPVLAKVLHALASPTQRRIKRLEAKLYIAIYEDDEESNQDILELAKLDFHILQQIHRDEVRSISMWYNDLNPMSMLGPYIRERPVECYYWALGLFYEPQHKMGRMMVAKLLILMSFFDDVIDSYGTMNEVQQFNQAFQRWDQEAAKQIADCYWYVIFHISSTLEDFVVEDGASPVGIDCFKETLKEGSKCMLQELEWREEGQVPTLDEYIKQAAAISTLYWSFAVLSFIGMGAADEVFTWARSFPKIIRSAAIICRLLDDVSGHENEKEERSKCVTAVDCYVKEHGVTVQQAKEALCSMIEEHWRAINQEYLSNDAVPVQMLNRVIDLARVMDGMYCEYDTYTMCSGVADPIHKLLNECVDH